MEITTAAITLFLIMDPLGNLPIWMSVLAGLPKQRRQWIIVRETIIALMIMLFFLYSGSTVLKVLSLSREAVAIAGGLVLLTIAMRMIFPMRHGGIMGDDESDNEPLIVPLAMPLLAGPSLMATLILLVENDPQHFSRWLYALLLSWFVAAVILFFGAHFYRLLGNRGLKAVERLMGMILLAVSVQMLLNAITAYVQSV